MDAFKFVAGFDPQSGFYTGPVPAYLSPLEQSYPLPAHAIALLPDDACLNVNQAFRLNATRDGWDVATDFSQATVYDKASSREVAAPARGDPLPDELTLTPPPAIAVHEATQWDADNDGWIVVPDLRGCRYWLADGSEHIIDRIGERCPESALTTPPPPSIDTLRTRAMARLSAWEETVRASGLDHAGRRWLTTPNAQQDIRDALLAGIVPGDLWFDASNEAVAIDLVGLQALWVAIVSRMADIYRHRLVMEADIKQMDATALASFNPDWPQ